MKKLGISQLSIWHEYVTFVNQIEYGPKFRTELANNIYFWACLIMI